jgi:hypothetical protein
VKRLIKLGFIVPMLLLAASCQSQYGSMQFFMGGVESTPLTDDREMIVAKGNAYTDASRIQQFVLLKAAEDCLAKGYTKFGFLGSEDTSNVSFLVNRGQSTTDATMTRYGDKATLAGTTTSTPTTIMPMVAPGATVYVKFLKGDELTVNTFDAKQVVANLGPVLKK